MIMKFCRIAVLALALSSSVSFAQTSATFSHNLEGVKPWSNEKFLDDPMEFHFAIVPDRTGGERKGVFGKAMDMLNLLRPEFVMSVGDLIARGGAENVNEQWDELESFISRLDMPFFYVVGNHDIWTGWTGMTPERRRSIDAWKARHGQRTFYDFTYKGCHFLCFDTMEKHDTFPPKEALSEEQISWALEEFAKHSDARWHFVFMHKPIDWTSDRWLEFERKIASYKYTVFCGDWHNHCTAVRNGHKYYMIGTAGGDWSGDAVKDLRRGNLDTITWVTVTDNGPVVSNIEISGVYGDTIQTCATSEGWLETPMDYPSHLSENPEKYIGETNSCLIPAEVMHGPGYDWHFRHAIILRQGLVYGSGMENPEITGGVRTSTGPKKRVMLLGDESASALKSEYPDAVVFDMGFPGDKIENVLWRVIEGEIKGYEPDEIVISAGAHNKGVNSRKEIAAGLAKLVSYVRDRAPKAVVTVR